MIVVTVSCTIIVITQFLLQTTFPHVGSITGDDSVFLLILDLKRVNTSHNTSSLDNPYSPFIPHIKLM